MTTFEFEQNPPLEPDTGRLAAPPPPEHYHLDALQHHFAGEDIDLLRIAAKHGNSDAMVTLGYCYQRLPNQTSGSGVIPIRNS